MQVKTPSSFNRRLPSRCFRKYIQTQLVGNSRFIDLLQYISDYPHSLDQASKSFDCIAHFSIGVDHSGQKNHPNYSFDWSKYDRPAPSRNVVEQIVLAYLEYRIYFSR